MDSAGVARRRRLRRLADRWDGRDPGRGRAVALADALADRPGRIEDACAPCEARLCPRAEAAQRIARRNVHLFRRANRFQPLAHDAVLRWAVLRCDLTVAPEVDESGSRGALA